MDINWGAFDGVLGVILLIVVIWMALKIATRLILGLIIIVVIGIAFFGWHLGGFAPG